MRHRTVRTGGGWRFAYPPYDPEQACPNLHEVAWPVDMQNKNKAEDTPCVG